YRKPHSNGAPPPCRRTPVSGSSQGKCFWAIPSRSSLFHGVDRTVGALGIGNENVVAELILPRDKVFLGAFAFSDLIMTVGIATENSCRLPGCLQDLRRRDFKIVVENIRLRQIKPFENMHVAIVRNSGGLADRDIGLRRD